MMIYCVKQDETKGTADYVNIANWEAFLRKLNDTYEVWSFNEEDIDEAILSLRCIQGKENI